MRKTAVTLFAALAACLVHPRRARGAEPNARPDEPPGVRVALSPALARAFRPRTVSRDALALAIEIAPNRRFALGLEGDYYAPFDAPHAASRLSWPLTQTLGSLLFDVKGTVLGGHENGRGADVYLVGGLGAIATRPVSVVDPYHRRFDYAARLALALGLGARLPLGRSIAAFAEVRDTAYVEQLESGAIAPEHADPSTWFGDKPLVHLVTARVGLTFYVPR